MLASSAAADAATFGIGAAVSLGASALLASRIERLGARIGISEALLGMLAALGADSPEITSSITALRSGQHAIGIGVVLGSNVFNLAALLGVGALAAGRIALHRRVIALEGTVAMWIVGTALLVAAHVVPAAAGLVLALAALLPYLVLIGFRRSTLERIRFPRRPLAWLEESVHEEELELEPFPPVGGRPRVDILLTVGAVLVVIAASVMMERAGAAIGTRYQLPTIVTGGVILAAVTSLPNAVAAVYLARRGRGAAVLSEAMNSNALNVVVGLLLSGAIIGLGGLGNSALEVGAWYGGLTAGCLVLAYWLRGLNRLAGTAIVVAYAIFLVVLVA